MDNAKSIMELLDALVSDNPGAIGCLIVGMDGVIIQSNLPDNYSTDYLAAGGASLTALADTVLNFCSGGNLERLRLGGSQGQLLATPIADDVVLVMIARRSINPDLAFESAGATALSLSRYL
ncbi:MAG: roadblock/LC7 domain-containing protein [Gammaproteobacteria bacterium]